MTGPIVKLNWVVDVKAEFRGSSFQVLDQITELYHQVRS